MTLHVFNTADPEPVYLNRSLASAEKRLALYTTYLDWSANGRNAQQADLTALRRQYLRAVERYHDKVSSENHNLVENRRNYKETEFHQRYAGQAELVDLAIIRYEESRCFEELKGSIASAFDSLMLNFVKEFPPSGIFHQDGVPKQLDSSISREFALIEWALASLKWRWSSRVAGDEAMYIPDGQMKRKERNALTHLYAKFLYWFFEAGASLIIGGYE
ncbi:hypothetical protein OIV83_005653 [Microbotryomycetes sp. JL201]|nr:hypothetical protein OIV83_005653 [Microbotryomycetes sp. JL201]